MKEKVRTRIDILRPLLKDAVPGVRIAAAQAIEKLEGISSTEEILHTLKTGDMGARIGAIYALGEIGGTKVLPPLIYCAGRPEVDIRSAAVEVLGRLGLPAASPVLVERLEDQHGAVQARAISALSHFTASPDVLQKLRRFLDSNDGALEAEAAITLATLRDLDSLDSMISLLSSNYASTRQAAAVALSLMPLQ
ncbi:MAG: HEAT repeat domain-containing protein [Steroidobacteraceae bacterium]|nr:HEAT repeat domain-containing protein [Deltaproteobacteria bacterium]